MPNPLSITFWEDTLIALCKRFGRFKIAQLIGLSLTWHKTTRWLKKSAMPPLKREMILMMRDATYLGLLQLNWWVPKHTLSNTPAPDLQKVRQAAYLEKQRRD